MGRRTRDDELTLRMHAKTKARLQQAVKRANRDPKARATMSSLAEAFIIDGLDRMDQDAAAVPSGIAPVDAESAMAGSI